MSLPLPSYVRSYRKRWQLSQRELAFLLGLSSQAVIAQHEALARVPRPKTLLKYEMLFDQPIGELFPKLHKEAEDEMAAQVKAFMERLNQRAGLPASNKLDLLAKFVERLDAGLP